MLSASSIRAFDTCPATRMHGSLKRTRTDRGVCDIYVLKLEGKH